jgi:DNA-binding transcriptional regulator YhcF (GntR family)
MNVKPNAVPDIVSYVLDRLASGLYPPGGRLPTSREMARELGVHRNTVAKAYRSLVEMGVISSAPGRGTFAAARLDLDNRRLHAQQIGDRLAEDILRARRSNISEDDLRRTIDERIATIYHAPPPRGAFVECNVEDLRVAIAEIEQQSDVHLAPLLLDALAADAAGIVANFDVVFTSLFHLLEVRELLAAARPCRRIIGIHTQPDERGLAEIAQIEPDAHVGIVVSNGDGARRFRAQLQTFTEAKLQILIQPTDEAIRILANEVDLIVTSRSRAAQIRRLNLSIPLIELSFHISRESANRVVDALYNATNADQHPGQEVTTGRRTPAPAV